jgi:hypothetical protein
VASLSPIDTLSVTDVETFAFAAAVDGRLSLARAIAGIEADEESLETAAQIFEATAAMRVDELAAAASIDAELTVPVAATLLQIYLYRWTDGGSDAALRLTNILDPSQLPASDSEGTLLHWIWGCAEPLAFFSFEAEDISGGAIEELDASANAAQAFRRLARVLWSINAVDDALACGLSAVSLAMWSSEAPACVDLALELASASDDKSVSLFLKARQADVLVRRCTADPSLATAAFDAVESVVRHLGDLPEQREQLLTQLSGSLNASEVLAGIRPLLRAAMMPPSDNALFDDTVRLFSSARWEEPWPRLAELAEPISVLAIELENARRRLEPADDAAGASTKWATWSFEYPPFRRAVPHGPSLQRETGLDELFLTVTHETIHVLSMMSGLGQAVTALRLALLEIEFRLWTFLGPPDPEAFSSIGVAPLVEGEVTALAQAESALEITRKLQILQDVWGPWLEGIAVFGELGAASPDDPFSSVVTLVLANLMEEGPIREAAAAEGISVGDVISRRQTNAEEIFAAAGRDQGAARLRTMLADYPARYFAGYAAVRAVVSSWRATYPGQISAQMAFRVLLHVSRFGVAEAVPDLALSASDFRRDALARLENWVARLAGIPAEDLDKFSRPDAEAGPSEWRDGRLIPSRQDAEESGEETHKASIERCVQALRTLSGAWADLDRVPDSDKETRMLLESAAEALALQSFDLGSLDRDPWLVDRMPARAAMMPIGRVRSPFWLAPESRRLFVLLRTTDRAPGQGDPLHQMIATDLPEEKVPELAQEMRDRRDSRMLIARVANLRELMKADDTALPGANYLVFSYGNWIYVQPGGMAEGAGRVSSRIEESVRERIQPDAILDFESDLTAEGRAGAMRTSSWIESVETWTAGGTSYDAGKWAARVGALATEVLDRESHTETAAAAEVLLSAVLGAARPADLGERGLELLRSADPTWIAEIAEQLTASSSGPVESSFLDAHGEQVGERIGPIFARSESGWDVRPIDQEA